MKSLKLNKLANDQLNEKEMNQVNGGNGVWTCQCGCACATANNGGPSTNTNMNANNNLSTTSIGQTQQVGDSYNCNGTTGTYATVGSSTTIIITGRK